MEFIGNHFDWWRAGHIIFVIYWVAGLLILPRYFIHQWEAEPGSDVAARIVKRQKMLIKIVLNPSLVFVWSFGILLILAHASWDGGFGFLKQPAWITKLVLVTVVTCMHFFYLLEQRQFSQGHRTRSRKFWRTINEIPAILTIFIVIVAVVYI